MISAISTHSYRVFAPVVERVALRKALSVLDEIPMLVLPNSTSQEFVSRVSHETSSPYIPDQRMSDWLGQTVRSVIRPEDRAEIDKRVYQEPPYACLIKNCPIAVSVPTPKIDRHNPNNGFVGERFLLGLAHTLHADPFHAKGEKQGELFAQVIAIDGHEHESSSRGSLTTFDLHTEHVHLRPGIDLLSLLCLRGDPAAVTEIIPVGQFLQDLPQWVIDAMREPIFEMSSRSSVDQTDEKRILPILEPDGQGGYFIRYNSEIGRRVVGLNSLADHVLNHLRRRSSEIRDGLKVSLEAGDCLVMNNRRVLHRRLGYVPTTFDRWLIRLYMTRMPANR